MLNIQPSAYSLLLIFASAVVFMLSVQQWQMRRVREMAAAISLLLLCGSLWILTNALEVASTDLETALIWKKIQAIAVIFTPFSWTIIGIRLAGYGRVLTRRTLLLLGIAPTIIVALAMTNEVHHLFFFGATLESENGFAHLKLEFGLAAKLYIVYSYAQILGSAVLLARNLINRRGGFRWQGTVVLSGLAITIAANILDLTGRGPIPQFRLTPFSVALAVPIFLLTLTRARQADILPFARSSLIQAMRDCVIVVDMESRILDLNPASERMIGTSLPDAKGKLIADIWPVWSQNSETWLQSEITSQEIRLRDKGRDYVFDVIVSPIKDWRGHVISRALFLHDISERVKADDTLRLKEEYFRALTEHSTDITIITDIQGVVQYVSPSLIRLFGRSSEEVVGKHTFEFVHPDDVPKLMAGMADALAAQSATGAVTARFHDVNGKYHILECIGSNMLDHPAIRGIVVNARDVTERESVLDILRQSEERYRLHFSNVNDVLYSFDENLCITSVSPSIERHLGYRPEELIGKRMSDVEILPPQYLEKALNEAIRTFSGERVEGSIYEFVGRNGVHKFAEISGSPIFRDGKVIGSINVARDITERIQGENRIRASLAEKEVLLKEIHHRVKNNLQIISSMLNLQAAEFDDPRLLEQFQDGQNRIRSMALIHERLYRSSDLAYIELGSYLRDLTHFLSQTLLRRNQNVKVIVDTDNVWADIDTAIPCGLMTNELVSNAFKHAFPNGRDGMITVSLRPDGEDRVSLEVQDNGVGIPAGLDLHQATTLGLKLVSTLANQLDATVSLISNTGTTFRAVFPVRNSLQIMAS